MPGSSTALSMDRSPLRIGRFRQAPYPARFRPPNASRYLHSRRHRKTMTARGFCPNKRTGKAGGELKMKKLLHERNN